VRRSGSKASEERTWRQGRPNPSKLTTCSRNIDEAEEEDDDDEDDEEVEVEVDNSGVGPTLFKEGEEDDDGA
jgi:hypothetical protein